jgi:hypothetical protein
MVGHIVLFQPKADLSSEATGRFVETLTRGFREIPGILSVRVGKRLTDGVMYAKDIGDSTYSHAAILEFADRETFVRYLEHPAHAAIGRQFWETCEATLILDIESVDPRTSEISYLLVK